MPSPSTPRRAVRVSPFFWLTLGYKAFVTVLATTIGLTPWFWLTLGLLGCLGAGVWLSVVGDALEPFRVSLVWVGLFATGVGITLQFRSTQLSKLAKAARQLQPVTALIFILMALGATANLVASWCGEYPIGLRPGLSLIFWLFVAPMSALAGWQILQRWLTQAGWQWSDEAALSLLLAGVVALLGCLALSTNQDFTAGWFTIQRFLFVMGLVALTGAPLAVVDVTTRKCVVSGLVLFHLLGIVTAAVGHPPAPWLVNQIWSRIYRPYFQFMYLSNAYHFYSPEPGPPSHVWFRLYYEDEQGQRLGHWYKIPRLEDDGRHRHTTSLEYQRYLSITEHTMPVDIVPIESPFFQTILEKRVAWTPEGAKREAVVGQAPLSRDVLVPFNPTLPKSQQFHWPQPHVKRIVESYARHVIHKHAGEHPDRNYTSVRIYHIIHRIIPRDMYFYAIEPTDPELYTPVYMGEFDKTGKLRDVTDPLLYWQLPILRDQPGILNSTIKDWARKHAGDPYWIRSFDNAGHPRWVDDNGKPPTD